MNMVVLVEGSVDDSDLLAHLEIYTHPQNPDSSPRLTKLVDQVGSWEKMQVTLEGVQPNRLYEVRAYYRRCLNSECTRLEPPTGGCAQAAQPTSAGTTFVTVELGNPAGCRIASDTAGLFPPRRSMELTTAPLGHRGCDPASPTTPDRLPETLGTTSDRATAWALLWAQPPFEVGAEVKMVFRVTGSGEFAISAIHENGTSVEPSWPSGGPTQRGPNESNYDRPGDEWALAYTFPQSGCWNLHVDRGQESVDFWFLVEASRKWGR